MSRSRGRLLAPRRFAFSRRLGRGFTLLESLTALAIFSVAIVGLIQAVTVQIRVETVAEDTTRAVILAENLLESLRQGGNVSEGEESDEYMGDDEGFAWSYQVQSADIDGLFLVTATISWSDGLASRSYSTVTYMTNR